MPGLLGDFGKGLLGFVSDPQSWKDMGTNAKGLLGQLNQPLQMEGRAMLLPFQDTMPGSVMNKRSLATPGMLAAALNAFTAPARAMNALDVDESGALRNTFNAPEEAANFAGNVMGGGLATSGRLPANALGMNVWHGSPHKFDKFDMSKIGTGEGAQAYGHGLYFAESRDVANGYREKLSTNVTVDGKKLQTMPSDGPMAEAHNNVVTRIQKGMAPDAAIAEVKKYWIDAANEMRAFAKDNPQLADRIEKEALSRMEVANAAATLNPQSFYRDPGALYKVDLPDDQIAKMLDWDRPLSQQAPEVQAAVAPIYRKYVSPEVKTQILKNGEVVPTTDKDFSLLQSIASNGYDNVLAKQQKSIAEAANKLPANHPVLRAKQAVLDKIIALSGQNVRQEIVNRGLKMSEVTGGDLVKAMGNDSTASQGLLGLGIPGIRYLDGGSRGAGQGTSNFVIFDDKIPKIIGRE